MKLTADQIKYFEALDKKGLGSPNFMPGPSLPAPPAAIPGVEVQANTDTVTDNSFKKYLPIAAAAGIGLLLLTSKKQKTLRGMKIGLDVKKIGKNILPEAEHIALVAGGMVASQKFLDLAKLADMLPEAAKSNKVVQTLVAHQGGVKLVIGVSIAAMSKNQMVKALCYGVAIGGLIKEIRTLTGGDTSWVPTIGANGSIFNKNMLKDQSFNTVLNGNPAIDRSQNTVLGKMGMTPPTPSTIGCADYGSGY